MRAAIITAPRKDGIDYLPGTLDSMLRSAADVASLEVRVFADSTAIPNIVPSRHKYLAARISHESRTEQELQALKDQGYSQLGAANMIRAFAWLADGEGPGIMFEDDLEFCSKWDETAKQAAALLAEPKVKRVTRGAPWVVTLHNMIPYCGNLNPLAVTATGRMLYELRGVNSFGSQAYMMLPEVFKAIGGRCKAEIAAAADAKAAYQWIMDVGVMRCCNIEHLAAMYVVLPCLVKHIGMSSTWSDVGGGPAAETCLYQP